MKPILEALQGIDIDTTSSKRFDKQASYTAEELDALNALKAGCDDYFQTRLINLKNLAEMMAICGQDEEIGHFDMNTVTSLGYFFAEELETLQHLDYLKDVALEGIRHADSLKAKGG